ncbi:MAG: DUF929 family protein [Actinomycetes bacterium]
MSTGKTDRSAPRRARAAEMRAAQARAERRRRLLFGGGAVLAVLALFVVLVVVKVTRGSSSSGTTSAGPSDRAPASVVRAVTSVPASTLDKVGIGTAQTAPRRLTAPPVTANGKPKMLYVGAEYCPFCAAERWPVVVALSRFGKWSGLGVTASDPKDVYPSTKSLSFHGASYTSDYLAFTGVETEDVARQPLDTLDPADAKLFQTYDQPPYTAGTAGAIPFIDFAGRYVGSGASYTPDVLAGKTQAQIAAALKNPSNPIAQAVNGTANVLSAVLCDVTKGQPANVCTSPGVKTAAAALAKAQKQ